MIHLGSSDDEIIQFLSEVKRDASSDASLAAELAAVLAQSGEISNFDNLGVTADVASTGGPSSLSTLLCPLYLCFAGCVVPKLGVPGRPAGGIDCLAQLPGYKTSLSPNDLEEALTACGYVHFLSSDRYAPLDARVFRLRQQSDAQDVPSLVAASLLSKKLAVGVKYAGLDVRVAPYGNFGRTWSDAKANAMLFTRAASHHGINAFPVLTDGRYPYQPFIGRREALVALSDIFSGITSSFWLHEHVELCRTLALACAPASARDSIVEASSQDLRRCFYANIESQGSSPEDFDRIVKETSAAHSRTAYAKTHGFVEYSLNGIRRALVDIQRSMNATRAEFPDPAGVILLRKPGEWVKRGDPVATIRVEDPVGVDVARVLEDSICRFVGRPTGPNFEGANTHE